MNCSTAGGPLDGVLFWGGGWGRLHQVRLELATSRGAGALAALKVPRALALTIRGEGIWGCVAVSVP